MNSNKKKVNMYFAALWPELLTKTPVSFVLIHPVLILGLLMLDPLLRKFLKIPTFSAEKSYSTGGRG